MIKIAYCHPCRALVHAQFAYRNRDLRFHCCTPGCGIPVFPNLIDRTGTIFFESQDDDINGPIIPDCPHAPVEIRKSDSSGRSSGQQQQVSELPILVPTTLQPPRPILRDKGPLPTRRQIVELMKGATLAEVPGSLDDILDAASAIYGKEDQYGLKIRGIQKNYRSGIRLVETMSHPWVEGEWLGTIVVLSSTLEAGNAPDYWMFREHGERERIFIFRTPLRTCLKTSYLDQATASTRASEQRLP